jgi:hypothetical protein
VQDVPVDLEVPTTGGTLASGPGAFPPPDVTASNARDEGKASFDDFGFGAPVPPAESKGDATLFSPAGGPAPIPTMGPAEQLDPSSAADLGFGAPDPAATPPADDLGFGAPDPARASREQHGTLLMGSDAPREDDSSLGIPDDDDDSSFADLSVELEQETPSGSPAAPAVPAVAGEGLADLAVSIEPGTLCFVHGDGVGEELAGYIGVPFAVVDDGPDGTREVFEFLDRKAEPGTVVVRMEDPSARLGFLLRRLEEGWRVLVETRARTAEGARRILLGVGATAVAEAWLDAQVTNWAMLEEGRWKLL